MRQESIKLGFCPIGKFVFSHEDAVRQKRLLEAKLREWGVRYVALDGVLEDGMVRAQSHVDPAVAHLRREGVEALFLPHCNFGTEGAAGMVAAKLGVPTLLWGPRDEAPLPDGTRLRDTLCGLFASSKVLHKLGVPFTYLENCRVDDAVLRQGVEMFLRAVNVADALRNGTRIGHLGQRIDFFWTTIVNESELLERFKVEVLPLDLVEFIRAAKDRAARGRAAYEQEARELRQTATVEFLEDPALVNIFAVRDQLLALGEEHGLEGFAIQDFMSLVDEMGAYCFYSDSAVADHYAVGYESDIHGALSCILMRRAAGGSPAFLADLTIRHPENDNGILLWHAGAPLSLRHPEARVRLGKHWILPSPLSGMTHFRLKDGPITVARFDGDRGEYQLAVGQGRSMDGPDTQNNYVWMEVDHWPRWERLLMEGPFIHHAAMGYGHYGDALVEACKYVPGLSPLRLDRAA
ncbi:MAG: fucose isomerase [Armatimonadetes bacterium]|nr:fucose isomerase [Armatimonadota bacterium]